MGQTLLSFSGARVSRVIDRGGGVVDAHAHDWPVLSLFVIGAYCNTTELGTRHIDGPSAVLYRSRAVHRNVAGPNGFEQIEIEFDPAWLGISERRLPDALHWSDGFSATLSSALIEACMAPADEEALRLGLRRFLQQVQRGHGRPVPTWLASVRQRLERSPDPSVHALARELHLHPAYLGQTYARMTGESILSLRARLRAERAVYLLRESNESPTAIAAAVGFHDQSHMSRVLRRLLKRTPAQLRRDRTYMRQSITLE